MDHVISSTMLKAPYWGAIIPYKSPIDKIAAVAVLQLNLENPIEHVEFWKRDDCPKEQHDAWEQQGLLAIDIGDQKYHRTGAGSALEFVVGKLGIELTRGGQELLRLVNHNNRTGALKNGHWAIPDILRGLYELSDDNEYHLMVIQKTVFAVQTFIRACDMGSAPLKPMPTELVDVFGRTTNTSPLSVGRLIIDLWMLGETSVDDIIQNALFWIEGSDKVQFETEKGRTEFKTTEDKARKFRAGVHHGIVLHTDNLFVTRAAVAAKSHGGQPIYPIRIVRKSSGQVSITTNQLNLSAVAAELMRHENSRWYHQEKMGTLHNGSVQYTDVKPTSFSDDDLIAMLQEFPPPPKQRKPYKK